MKRTVKCVSCGRPLRPRDIRAAGPFACPGCGAQLQAPNSYGQWVGSGSLLFSVVASLALGFRGLHLLYAVLSLLIVVDVFAINLSKYVVLPDVEVAIPPTPFPKLLRQIYGRTELNLRDKGRPHAPDEDFNRNSRT
jgi:hypothetical protein